MLRTLAHQTLRRAAAPCRAAALTSTRSLSLLAGTSSSNSGSPLSFASVLLGTAAAAVAITPARCDAGPGPEADDIDWSDLQTAPDEDTGCSFCHFMRESPCGNHFRRWERCVAENKGDDKDGNALFVSKCFEPTKGMQECIVRNQQYYDDERAKSKKEAAREAGEASRYLTKRGVTTRACWCPLCSHVRLPPPPCSHMCVDVCAAHYCLSRIRFSQRAPTRQ